MWNEGGFTKEHARLINARIRVMARDIRLGETLCRYTFAPGDRPATLARDGRRISYNPDYVADANEGELVEMLIGIAERAPPIEQA